jgi:MscS family membrane protein
MYRLFDRLLTALMLVLMFASVAMGFNNGPLDPPDTSSPRATLESFLYYSKAFADSLRTPGKKNEESQEALKKTMQCFDLSSIPPHTAEDVGLEAMLQLREILDRIPLPDNIDIPDNNDVKKQNIVKWRIPHTEILIEKVEKGKQVDKFLFTAETVAQLDEYYAKVQHLPYKEGALQGIYEDYIYSPGWLIPRDFISALPDWMKLGYLKQAVWQWLCLVIAFVLAGLLFWTLLRWYRKWTPKESRREWNAYRVIAPVSAMGLCSLLIYLIDEQINITGVVLNVINIGLNFIFYTFIAWAVLVCGNVVIQGVITSQHIKEEALDADVIRIAGRLFSFFLVFAVYYRAGNYFGLPVAALFTSAGIAGVAVALAARETLANFFGGVSIFLDRPFRTGDFIVLDNGERGEVQAVGMRSTRILTQDDILITIPNSVITNVKIVNQSMPRQHFRIHIKIEVAYGSNLEQVEKVLMDLAQKSPLVKKTPLPQVRVCSFGNSAINLELLVWAFRPHDQGLLTHELNNAIYKRFSEEGIEIPYPQLDIHMHPEKEKIQKDTSQNTEVVPGGS